MYQSFQDLAVLDCGDEGVVVVERERDELDVLAFEGYWLDYFVLHKCKSIVAERWDKLPLYRTS